MTDSTVDITGPFDRPQKLLKIIDNGDGTYSIAAGVTSSTLPTGASTSSNQSLEIAQKTESKKRRRKFAKLIY